MENKDVWMPKIGMTMEARFLVIQRKRKWYHLAFPYLYLPQGYDKP